MVGTYVPSTVDFYVHFSKDASNMLVGLVVAEAHKKMKGKVHLSREGKKIFAIPATIWKWSI